MDQNQIQTAQELSAGEEFWSRLVSCQSQTFYTEKKLPFTYRIRGGEMFVDRRSKSITKATILKAYDRVMEDTGHLIQGPKKLNCFGAPYVWAIFRELGVVTVDKTSHPGRKKKSDTE